MSPIEARCRGLDLRRQSGGGADGYCRGLAIMLTVLAFNLVGDTLRDLLDPRMRGLR